MKEFITPDSLANSIRMKRTQFAGSFMVVEGDIDARFYKNFIEQKECQIEIAFNKDNAIKVLEKLQSDLFKGVIAIIDADFDVLEEKINENFNLFFTDFHDLECLIFVSPALEKVLAEFGSEEKIVRFGKDVRNYLFDKGSFIGYLRWISLSDGLNLTFEGLNFSKFVEKDTLDFRNSELVRRVMINSQTSTLQQDKIIEKIIALTNKNHDKRQVSCGKDLIEILSIGLQKVLGTNNSNKVTSEIIARDLRLAYEFEFFVSTGLYQNVKIWEQQNVPFRVFR